MPAPHFEGHETPGLRFFEVAVFFLVLIGSASVLIPIFTSESRPAAMTRAGNQAHGIHLGLMNYAGDHDGAFPTATRSANEAFRKLIPEYIADERPFHVPGSPWHLTSKSGQGPDNEIGPPPDYPLALEKGENHWAYISGLDNTSNANLPLVLDGFSITTGPPGQNVKDGRWKTRAIVVYVDGAVKQEAVDPKSGRILKTVGGKQVDFISELEKDPEIRVLNPE